jgi:hypothetical protein
VKKNSLNDLLRKNPSAQVETIKSFTNNKTKDLVELKEVGNAGLLLRISLTVNGVEAHFHDILGSDN